MSSDILCGILDTAKMCCLEIVRSWKDFKKRFPLGDIWRLQKTFATSILYENDFFNEFYFAGVKTHRYRPWNTHYTAISFGVIGFTIFVLIQGQY